MKKKLSYLLAIILLFGLILVVAVFVLKCIRVVEKICMIKKVSVDSLVEGDWVASAVKVKGKVVCSVRDLGMSKKQINILKKNKVRRVLIKSGIPFVPSFLIALVLTFVFGNLFRIIIGF